MLCGKNRTRLGSLPVSCFACALRFDPPLSCFSFCFFGCDVVLQQSCVRAGFLGGKTLILLLGACGLWLV